MQIQGTHRCCLSFHRRTTQLSFLSSSLLLKCRTCISWASHACVHPSSGLDRPFNRVVSRLWYLGRVWVNHGRTEVNRHKKPTKTALGDAFLNCLDRPIFLGGRPFSFWKLSRHLAVDRSILAVDLSFSGNSLESSSRSAKPTVDCCDSGWSLDIQRSTVVTSITEIPLQTSVSWGRTYFSPT